MDFEKLLAQDLIECLERDVLSFVMARPGVEQSHVHQMPSPSDLAPNSALNSVANTSIGQYGLQCCKPMSASKEERFQKRAQPQLCCVQCYIGR